MNLKIVKNKNPLLMGVLNCTPDSFSDGGNFFSLENAVIQAKKMISNGANIIDIGGQSSRPGALSIAMEEEQLRVIPVIKKIREFSDIPISIDTTNPIIAEKSLEAGATIINDIKGLRSSKMIDVVAKYQCPVVIMHMQGDPQNMQKKPYYKDVVQEIKEFFLQKISLLKKKNVTNIILDPGIGFGKTVAHNWEILRNLSEFREIGLPILLGVSRKSFLAEITGIIDPKGRDEATLAIHLLTKKYTDIWRVHDVEIHKRYIDGY